MDDMKNEAYNSEQIKRVMKKTRNKMTMRMIRVFAICMGVIILIANTPNFLYYLQQNRIADAQKLAMLGYEFSTTDKISGYSVNNEEGLSFDRIIRLYYKGNVAGRNVFSGEQKEISIMYNLLNRKVAIHYPLNGTFMHKDRFNDLEESYQQELIEDNAKAITALEKNKNNTVTLLDLSFKRTFRMDEVMRFAEDLDIEINWFAIETGHEKLAPPSNIGMPAQQYYLWGFPSKLYTPERIFEPISLDKKDVNKHLEAVLGDLKWMQDHATLVEKNKLWFIDENIHDYLSQNGFQCYGIQVNGPTDQIYELIQRVDYQYINIQKIDLWYW